MENYESNEISNEVSEYSNNYPAVYNPTYAPTELNGYYSQNGQFSYNNYYANYYAPPLNYGQFGYQYPTYNYSAPLEPLTTLAVEKPESIANTSNESSISTTSSASLISANGDYVSTVSPIPNAEESTPYNSLVTSNQVSQNLSGFYPTPPSGDVSNISENNLTTDSHRKSQSPEVVPKVIVSQTGNESAESHKRRTRTQFDKYQIETLEAMFGVNHYPDVQTVDHLSEKLGLQIERISVWFQNRRAKFKKTKKPTSTNFSAERLYSVS